MRERLFETLDRLGRHPVIWIAGPPGAGKTTLVGSWLESRQHAYLWFHADADDGDAPTFFYYLRQAAAALSRQRKPLPLLAPEYLGDLDTFTRRFFRELFSRLPASAMLVIDNCHDIAADSVAPPPLMRVAASAESRLTLVATALLPSFDEHQAVALAANANAPKLLDFLFRQHLFTDRHDGPAPRYRYRYHNLFRTFLLR